MTHPYVQHTSDPDQGIRKIFKTIKNVNSLQSCRDGLLVFCSGVLLKSSILKESWVDEELVKKRIQVIKEVLTL